MPSLDYIEKLTGIKEDWIQNSNFAHGKHPVCLDKSA